MPIRVLGIECEKDEGARTPGGLVRLSHGVGRIGGGKFRGRPEQGLLNHGT